MSFQLQSNKEPICSICPTGTKLWKLNDQLHRLDGPAIEWYDDEKSWFIIDKFVNITNQTLTVGQSIQWLNTIALVIKQINHTLFQVLVGNKKEYLFSLYNTDEYLTDNYYNHILLESLNDGI